MANKQQDKIEYDFEDLRRNEDPVPGNILGQLGLEDEDLTESERHDDKSGNEADDEQDDTEILGKDLDDDDTEYDPVKMTRAMRKRLLDVQRKATRSIAEAKDEAGATISKLEKRIDELERSGKTDALEGEFADKIVELEAAIEVQMEKGDSKEVIRLTTELAEVTADKRVKRSELEAQHEEPDDLDDQPVTLIPRAQEWIDEQDWWDDPDYAHIRGYVRRADMALQKKGYRPSDDEFYEQLETLVEKKYPGVVEMTMEDLDEEEEENLDEDEEGEFEDVPSKRSRRKAARSKKKAGRRRRSPVSVGDESGIGRSRKKRVAKKTKTLSRARIANMRIFGMDPEDPSHVESYIEGID